METILITIGTSILGLIGYLIISAFVKAPGKLLQQKFDLLTKDTDGKIAGKTLDEIVKVCGNPSSVASVGDGTTLRQWMSTGYHLALLFDSNDICIGISSETSV
ncbi:MAG: hypothetical protein ACI4RU_03935 [Acutalibacteraceae bacterium]